MDTYQPVFSALTFSATMHRHQRRKGYNSIPYINHPIGVADLIVRVAGVEDVRVIQAALLHDVVEDTPVTFEEIQKNFGNEVATLVEELTDDTTLTSSKRKEMQLKTASLLSDKARLIRIADKICNIDDIMKYPLPWTRKRKISYVHWARKVVEQCKGINEDLEKLFDETSDKALAWFR